MDWNAFEFSYGHRGMAALSAQLIQIDGYREAALNLVLPPMWREQLDGLNRVRAVHGTTALEGNPLSEEEVSEQIDQLTMQPDASEMSREQAQIRNAGLAAGLDQGTVHAGSTSGDVRGCHANACPRNSRIG